MGLFRTTQDFVSILMTLAYRLLSGVGAQIRVYVQKPCHNRKHVRASLRKS